MAKTKNSNPSLPLKDFGNTYTKMLTRMVRTTHQIPHAVNDKQLASIVLIATETARTEKACRSHSSDMNTSIAGINTALTMLENEGTRSAHEFKTSYQQKFALYRGTANDLISRREELTKQMNTFIIHLDKKVKEMIKALAKNRGRSMVNKTIAELRTELANIQKSLDNVNVNENSLTYNLVALLKECAQTTKAITGRDVLAPEARETPQPRT